MFARREILVGDAEILVAGGMESMTNAPYLLPNARAGYRMGNGQLVDSMIHDGLWDPVRQRAHGQLRRRGGREVRASRARTQDAFARASFERAHPGPEGRQVQGRDRRACRCRSGRATRCIVDEDEGPKKAQLDKMPGLKPAFTKDGTVTAANASTHQRRRARRSWSRRPSVAKKRGLPVLARIVGDSTAAVEPKWFTIAPVEALTQALREDRHEAARLGPLRDQRGLLGRHDGGDEGARRSRTSASTCTAARCRSATRSAARARASW